MKNEQPPSVIEPETKQTRRVKQTVIETPKALPEIEDDSNAVYYSREVYVKSLSLRQRINLQKLVRKFMDEGRKLENGQIVTDKGKAIRYLLENADC